MYTENFGIHSKTYSVTLVPEFYDNKYLLGMHLQPTEDKKLVVVDFSNHPKTNQQLPAEKSKIINLMDQLLAVNDIHLPANDLKGSYEVVDRAFKSSQAKNGVTLKFKSNSEKEVWFECPNCQHIIIVDRILKEV
jgi:hypothetical protein